MSTSAYLHHLAAVVDADTIRVTVADEHLNRGGRVHGGLLASILDSIMGHTVGENIPDGTTTATVSLTVNFLEPALKGDALIATADVIRRGSTLVIVQGQIHRESDGLQIAHALGTFTVLERRR